MGSDPVRSAETDARPEEHSDNCTQAVRFLSSEAYMTDGLELRSKVVTPEHFQPEDDDRGAEDCPPEHHLRGRSLRVGMRARTPARPSPGRSRRGLGRLGGG